MMPTYAQIETKRIPTLKKNKHKKEDKFKDVST